ncbi:MAG TPA: hypothetical protein DCS93_13220 [Microscillaceae bacterium]|nr:hypothetical protein [Microscillaceae bacterium]
MLITPKGKIQRKPAKPHFIGQFYTSSYSFMAPYFSTFLAFEVHIIAKNEPDLKMKRRKMRLASAEKL